MIIIEKIKNLTYKKDEPREWIILSENRELNNIDTENIKYT